MHSMANLLVEIGNTALKASWSEEMTLGKAFRYQGDKTTDFILSIVRKEKPEVMVIASVFAVPEEDAALLRNECHCLLLLDPNHKELMQKYFLPEYLSWDRAASVIAGRYLFKGKGCSVMDFGTTLTTDFTDSNGTYRGGNISPGCRTRFKALNRYSRTLPLVDIPQDILPEGNSIVSSIESGVISGIMFEIEGYLNLHPGNVTVFTGGDAIYFAKRMKSPIFVICNLQLMGLAIIADGYVKETVQ